MSSKKEPPVVMTRAVQNDVRMDLNTSETKANPYNLQAFGHWVPLHEALAVVLARIDPRRISDTGDAVPMGAA